MLYFIKKMIFVTNIGVCDKKLSKFDTGIHQGVRQYNKQNIFFNQAITICV